VRKARAGDTELVERQQCGFNVAGDLGARGIFQKRLERIA
jgi:hypothetical protein